MKSCSPPSPHRGDLPPGRLRRRAREAHRHLPERSSRQNRSCPPWRTPSGHWPEGRHDHLLPPPLPGRRPHRQPGGGQAGGDGIQKSDPGRQLPGRRPRPPSSSTSGRGSSPTSRPPALRGELAEQVSRGLMDCPVVFRSHGGRAAAIRSGELHIDVAFLGAPSCDPYGNANGYSRDDDGAIACGSMGYAPHRRQVRGQGGDPHQQPGPLPQRPLGHPGVRRRLHRGHRRHRRPQGHHVRGHPVHQEPQGAAHRPDPPPRSSTPPGICTTASPCRWAPAGPPGRRPVPAAG